MLVHLNGRLCRSEVARIDPADRGFTLGDGVFETMRVVGGRVPRIDAHLARLATGLVTLGIEAPHIALFLREGAAELLDVARIEAGAMRVTVTRGPAPRGLAPPERPEITRLITVRDAKPSQTSVTAVIADATRRNEHSPVSRIKALGYLDSIVALAEARRRGAGEAILLNTSGRVACATASNLFAVIDGALVTPPIADGALPGITRAEVLQSGGAVELSLTREDLARAEEIVLTTALGIRSLAALDGRTLAGGTVGDELRTRLFG